MKRFIAATTVFAAITIIFGTMYVIGQQSIRLSVNMPQIQAAEDAASRLDAGDKPEVVLPSSKIDINDSSAGFIIIYDKSGKVVAGNGVVDGKVPVIPYGVLQSTKPDGYHAVTWAISEARVASVEVQAKDYYVLAGRSLVEPEKLIETLGKLTLFGYILTLIVTAGGLLSWIRLKK